MSLEVVLVTRVVFKLSSVMSPFSQDLIKTQVEPSIDVLPYKNQTLCELKHSLSVL